MNLLRRYAIRWLGAAVLAAGLAAWAAGALRAGEMPAPAGMVLLTVGGDVQNWNRGRLDEARDGMFAFHEVEFERAMAFDQEMLARLEQGRVTAHPSQIEGPGTFAGPTLAAVLRAAGADSATVLILALDGYVVALSRAEREARDWILAATLDGTPLPLGGAGPLWLMHTPANGMAPSSEEEERWAWAAFYIEVE